ncbi:MAG: L-aspartate oxidase [Alphaproteobacteria bacterium]|nr:L-aspartate oxidase [Alphaproteobacteria bacterium]MCW5744141.1 L-aspartate oxidase [Alphaproteobacteria bacterium]
MNPILRNQPVIIGDGLAGLMTALLLAPQPVVLLARAALGDGAASQLSQGGIAAALGDDDRASLHAADTCAAGDGLTDPMVAARIATAGPAAIARLVDLGVAFDRDATGRLALGLEAAHSRRRIVHAAGDGTGAAIMRALIDAVRRTPSIAVVEAMQARRLLVDEQGTSGVLAAGGSGACVLPTRMVVLATGGLGGLFRHTTNPLGAIGHGVALAARAGATVADMEFVQFHPTALDVGRDPMPLVSEAVRGEGAVLVDETGYRFLEGKGRAELEPRDVVARGVAAHLAAGHRVFLDAREALGARFAQRFPAITALCRESGIDPVTQPIPVRPAAHYQMGGIAVDDDGRATVDGLWACGEVAATGLHGANRLASNSLLEAVVTAQRAARSVSGTMTARATTPQPAMLPPAPDPTDVRATISEALGVVRERAGIERAMERLQPLAFGATAAADPALVGLLIATAALARTESRGGHWRRDFPRTSPAWAHRLTQRVNDGGPHVVCRMMPSHASRTLAAGD